MPLRTELPHEHAEIDILLCRYQGDGSWHTEQ